MQTLRRRDWLNRARWAMRPEPRKRSVRARSARAAWMVGFAGAATGLGAGVMYLLDPILGRRRRAVLRDRSAAALRRTARRTERWGRRLQSDAAGWATHLRHLRFGDNPAPNDEALADRVRSQVLRDPAYHGRLNLNAQHGVVVLRGQLDRQEQIRAVVEATRRVAGVRDVQSYLHLPDAPPPNKQQALETERIGAVPPPFVEGASSSSDAIQPPV